MLSFGAQKDRNMQQPQRGSRFLAHHFTFESTRSSTPVNKVSIEYAVVYAVMLITMSILESLVFVLVSSLLVFHQYICLYIISKADVAILIYYALKSSVGVLCSLAKP